MIHDSDLLERLSALPIEPFFGEVFRATRKNYEPLAFSTRGGRWGLIGGVAVLYTSLERDGALAELSFHWGQLTPLPSKPAMLHTLRVSAHKTRRVLRSSLPLYNIDPTRFGELNYQRTQEVGEAVAFLGCDGLIAPSARWECENLMLFNDNFAIQSELILVGSQEVDWRTWASENGIDVIPKQKT